ncbi:MAG: diguanylate cyclase [Fimbriimonadaceae bacterium]|nr:diguanylate cyclase [Fimbriimonadaceae bacterium]
MLNIEDLQLLPVWVAPTHLAATARLLMAGHHMRVLAVVEDGALIGTVSSERLAAAPDFDPIRASIEPLGLVVQAGTPVRKVADLFVKEHIEYAPVVDGDRFLGMATANLLLQELGRSWDPLTHLPWSDRLREWGVDMLRQGKEICILFIDLNEFGRYNKRYGHIVGDRVLSRVARLLKECTDPRTDVLVRYGGDEFAVGTVRPREEAEALRQKLLDRTEEASVPEASEPVTYAVGLKGGKRTKERESVHFAATLDNLINLASQECLSLKPQPSAAAPETLVPADAFASEAEHGPKPEVVGVYTDERSPNALTTVFLKVGTSVVSGMHHRAGRTPVESIALATSKALERVVEGVTITIDSAELAGDGESAAVAVSCQLAKEGCQAAGEGSRPAGSDPHAATAQATIDAVFAGLALLAQDG